MSISRARIAVFSLILAGLAGPVFSQQTSGNLIGELFDPTGATVPGAKVVAHNDATGVDVTVTTTSAGDYRFSNLPAGVYTLSVDAAGFARAELRSVEVTLNQTGTANITL